MTCGLLERIGQVWPVELNVDHGLGLGILRIDLLEVGLGRLAFVVLLGFLSLFVQTVELKLFEDAALGSLLGVH